VQLLPGQPKLTLGVPHVEEVLKGGANQTVVLIALPSPEGSRFSTDLVYRKGQKGLNATACAVRLRFGLWMALGRALCDVGDGVGRSGQTPSKSARPRSAPGRAWGLVAPAGPDGLEVVPYHVRIVSPCAAGAGGLRRAALSEVSIGHSILSEFFTLFRRRSALVMMDSIKTATYLAGTRTALISSAPKALQAGGECYRTKSLS
jgi:hypothetical protein